MIDNQPWGLLGQYGDVHLIRAYHFTDPKPVREASDHRMREIRVNTSVKWRPHDTSTIIFQDVTPLGPRR